MTEALRDYQLTVFQKALAAIDQGLSPLIVMPTASGKTHVLVELLKRFEKSLTLAHRRQLILKPCGLLKAQGISFAQILSDIPPDYGHPRQLGTIDSLRRRGVLPDLSPDAVFIDEAHRCRNDSYTKVTDFCKRSKIPVIGLTATPTRLDRLSLGEVFDVLIEGPSLGELIEQGWVSPVQVFAAMRGVINRDQISSRGGEYIHGDLERATCDHALVGDAVQEWKEKAQGRSTLVFTTGDKHSLLVQDAYRAEGVSAEIINGKMSCKAQDRLLDRFSRSEIQVLIACQIPIEGIDLPECECVQVLRPTLSLVYWWQMIGRVMRKSERSAIVLDHAGNSWTLGLPHFGRIEWNLAGAQAEVGQIQICSKCGMLFDKKKFCDCVGKGRSVRRSLPQVVDGRLIDVSECIDFESIDKMIREGSRNLDIASLLGCPEKRIIARRKLLGIPGQKKIDYDLLDKLIRDGKSNPEIANILGYAKSTVSSRRTALGIPSKKKIDYDLLDKSIRDGKSDSEIIDILGYAKSTVSSRRTALGIPNRRLIDYKLMDKMILEGFPVSEIMDAFSCCRHSIGKRKRLLGVARKPIDKDELDRLIRCGMSNAEISRHLDCDRSTVISRRKVLGIPYKACDKPKNCAIRFSKISSSLSRSSGSIVHNP